MKIHFILFILLTIVLSTGLGQSPQDIEELRRLMKQYESQIGKLPSKTTESKKIETSIPSLEKFKQPQLSPAKFKKDTLKKDTSKIAPPKTAIKDSVDIFSQLQPFGFDFFQNLKPDLTPDIYGPVDNNYPIGPGDEIIITVWGEVQLRYDLIVDREGQIFIPDVGLVQTTGLNVRELKNKLRKIMGQYYSPLATGKAHLDVSLGKLRAIRIFVVGEVQTPGIYNVPALTSVVSILAFAGGPKTSGSLRKIFIVRSDSIIAKLDFYKFLTKGEKFGDVRLQNDDIILIPPVQKKIYLAGAVNHPAIFELTEDETLIDLIQFAGGFKEDAYFKHIEVERIVGNEDRKLADINFEEIAHEEINFPLLNGDRIYVPTIDRILRNYVTISGPIYGPNRFEYFPNMTISDLIARIDSIRGDAYLKRVQITRTLPNEKKQIFSVNLEAILNHEQGDVFLAPRDSITILSKLQLFPPDSVWIYGAVNKPGKYLLKENMTLKELIFTAGGFRKDALIEEAEISRVDPQHTSIDTLAQILYVKIDSNYTKQTLSPDEEFLLQPYDNVFIRANSDWELQRNVTIKGEVRYPGVYTLRHKRERITDLIYRAGGLKPTAYLKGATFIRTQNNVGQIGIDFEKILKNPDDEENIILQDGDVITIPEQLNSVKVVGAVNFPSSVVYEEGKGLDHYINAAGGYTDLANKKGVSIRLANGRVIRPKKILFWRHLPQEITPGSTIIVPALTEVKKTDWSGAIRDAAAILSSVATTILIINQVK